MLKFLSIQFLKLCKLTNKWGDLLYAVACDNIPYCTYRSPFIVLNEQTNGAPLRDFKKIVSRNYIEKFDSNILTMSMSLPSFLSAHIFDFGKNSFNLRCWLYLCIHLSAECTKIGSRLEMTLEWQIFSLKLIDQRILRSNKYLPPLYSSDST